MTSAGSAQGLCVEDLSVTYRRHGRRRPVLHEVGLDVTPGEALGVVGESGCGKSTLALAIARFLPRNGRVESGRVWLDGSDVLLLSRRELREVRGRKIGMVYQDPGAALNPALHVGEQVAEVFRAHGPCTRAEATARAREMLERVALPDAARMLRRYPHQLSGGQQQRVVIAMALAANPSLLILDEPTTGLDATVEAEVLDLINELRSAYRMALVFISHNLAVIGRVCERVAVLYAGRIVEAGETEQLFRSPQHPYTCSLLRCVPAIGATKRTRRLVAIPGSLPLLGAPAPGCQFSPRCGLADDRCTKDEPALAAAAPGTLVRCWRPGEMSLLAPGRQDQAAGAPAAGPLAGDAAEPGQVAGQPAGGSVRVEGLTKVFPGGVTACRDVSLEIRPGETVGLVGESGSGKSTLARCIAGLTRADSGRIWLGEAEMSPRLGRRSAAERRAIQMVFQNPDLTLNPSHSVGFVLRRAVRKLGGGADADSLAVATGIGQQQMAARCGQLSGGQKQRVAIARAFAGSPSVVLCDEPCSSLDVSVQATILNLFADVQQQTGVAYLFVSHDLGVVRYLADRIVVMYLGRVVEAGSAADVFLPPHHPYTEVLFSALLAAGPGPGRERIRLTGEPPSPRDVIRGCAFHTRCPRKIGDICETEEPPARTLPNGHVVRCHWAGEQLEELQQERPLVRAPDRTAAGGASPPSRSDPATDHAAVRQHR